MTPQDRTIRLVITLVIMALISGTASAQSVWDKIKAQAAKSKEQQQQPQAGQPQRSGQVAQGGVNDSGSFTPPPGTRIDPVVMAPMEEGSQFAVSPIGIHVATLSHAGSRPVIIYDGVAGPKFDQLFMEGGGSHPVVFSPDGNHWAYCGANGAQWTVMLDGKPLTQGTDSVNGAISSESCRLGFTSNSKHLYFTNAQSSDASHQSYHFVFDGKASPLGADGDMRNYAFSPDGNHVAYFVANPDPRVTTPAKLWIDGKPAPYDSGSPQWSADSQHLYTMRSVRAADPRMGSVQEFLYDGKIILRADFARLFIPPTGNMVVLAVSRQHVNPPIQSLVIGGQQVPGSEIAGQISDVVFSPDGKHYAAQYANANGRHFVFSDGKKGPEYPSLFNLPAAEGKTFGFETYTKDSSKLIYGSYDTLNGARYLIIGGEESDKLISLTDMAIAPSGNHVLTQGMGYFTVDGKTMPLPNVDPRSTQITDLSFSPDAQHFAFLLHDRPGYMVYLDAAAQKAYGPTNFGPLSNINTRGYVWSPDSKHIAYFCRPNNPAANNDIYLCVDGKATRVGPQNYYANLTFSGDSNHLFWTRNLTQGEVRIFMDGKPVYDGFPTSTAGFTKETWQIGPDGNLLVLMQGDTSLDRVSITPSASTSIDTMMGAH